MFFLDLIPELFIFAKNIIMIKRLLEPQIVEKLFKKKAIVVSGPRQTGKTTLIKKVLSQRPEPVLYIDGDSPVTYRLLSRPSPSQLKQIIANHKIVFIDEAQRIPDIGITCKIIIDSFPDVQLIISGSSSFELTQKMHEPLTGRQWTYHLYPMSWKEWQDEIGYLQAEESLENRLVFGFYPDVLNHSQEEKRVLKELTESYLYKDVLLYANLKKAEEIQKLLQALSYQVGHEVSYSELSEITGLDPKTVDKYITVLEQAFVVFRLGAFSRNLRNEIKKSRKIYFYDNGVRNAVIGQFQNFQIRNDKGALWENFLVSERLKWLSYNHIYANTYFWRTTQQQEIDYIEERNGKIAAYEFKLNPKKKFKFSVTFTKEYQSENTVINRENFRDFVMEIN